MGPSDLRSTEEAPAETISSPSGRIASLKRWLVQPHIQSVVFDVALAVGIAILSIPTLVQRSLSLLDGSWVLASSLGRVSGLNWGDDLAFTYGPLGFLKSPVPLTDGLVQATVLFWIGCYALLAYTVAYLAKPLGRGMAWFLAWIAASLAGVVAEMTAVVVLISLVAFIEIRREPGRLANTRLLVIAAVCGPLMLSKFNIGVVCWSLVFIVALSLAPRLKRLLGATAVAAASVLAVWTFLGNSLFNFPTFIRDSIEIARGYSHAMSSGGRYSAGAGVVELALLLSLLTLLLGFRASRGLGWITRMATMAVLVLVIVGSWLQAFTRFDPGHAVIFFATVGPIALALVGAVVGLSWGSFARGIAYAGTYAAAALPLLIAAGAGSPRPWPELVHPQTSLASFADAATLAISQGARESMLAGAAEGFRSQAGLPPEIASEISGRRVHAEPYALGAVWAHGGVWSPVPVYQTYSAYTGYLDERNAEVASGDRGPDRLLRQNIAVDFRHPLWESPRLQIGFACQYREILAAPPWSVHERSTPRCATPVPLGSQSIDPGEAVPVPPGEGLVVANITQAGPTARERLVIQCDDRRYELAQPLPSGPLIMSRSDAIEWTAETVPEGCSTVSFSESVAVDWERIPVQ